MKEIFLSVVLSMALSSGIGLDVMAQEISNDKINTTYVSTEDVSTEEAIEKVNKYLLDLINELRLEKGLKVLKSEKWLEDIASIRAVEASDYWSHTRPDGSEGIDMIPIDKWAGENLSYYTYSTFNYTDKECRTYAEAMFKMLCDSPTHYDNMIFSEFKTIGISTNVEILENGNIKLCTAYMFSN